jgi:hypothetical protein
MAHTKEKITLGVHLQEIPRCIWFIDGILIKIYKWNETHCTWFNGWKKIYAMNNIIILDHFGLFIYINIGYLVLTMMWTRYGTLVFIRICINISPMVMTTLNTYWEIQVIWAWGDVYYAKNRVMRASTKCSPCYSMGLQQNACSI